jgi:DNA polymerase elongation subunit (family B)
MTYISAALSENKRSVLVWERENNKIETKMYDAPYFFYVQDKHGKYKDINGKSLSKLEYSTGYEFYEAKKDHHDRNIKMFESDINPIYKVLSEQYYGKPTGKLNFTLFDIEVDYDPNRGFSSPENPYAPVSAISIYHHHLDKMILLVILPDNGKWTKKDIPADLHELSEIIVCKSEKELLLRFLDEIENSDIISGWNSSGFDVPYLYMRMLERYGEAMANRLSFHNAPVPKLKEVEIFKGSKTLQVDIFGRVHIDYLEMFKKFETTTRPSFTLDAISEEILPHMTKLEYDGSLYDLYYEDFPKFCRYNVRDTEVLKGFEDVLGYMGVAIATYHSATVLMNDVLGTIRVVEATINNKCHHTLNLIVPDAKERDYSSDNGKFAGALVTYPKVGMKKKVAAIDFSSLYPSIIRALNASPDTIIGQFYNNFVAYEEITMQSSKSLTLIKEDGESETHLANEWKDILKSRKCSLSANGTVFDQNKNGIISDILREWYEERVEYKNLAKKHKNLMKDITLSYKDKPNPPSYDKNSPMIREGILMAENDVKLYDEYKIKYDYYHRLQFIKKILLNSAYGAIGNIYFRFFDLRIAESTTRTGREALMFMNMIIANVIARKNVHVWQSAQNLNDDYTFPDDNIIYNDTDSTYFSLDNVNLGDDIDEVYEAAKIIASIVNEELVSFSREYLMCNDTFDTILKGELDVIADNSIFIKKKYYVMHLLYNEGVKLDKPKMKVMGLQIKKTTIPKPISKKLTRFVEELLEGNPWKDIAKRVVAYKDILIEDKITSIGLPKGIKNIEDYTNQFNKQIPGGPKVKLPGHVAAAMFYNKCLEIYDDKESPKIVSGMKIKTYYLTKKFDRFKSIALPTDTKVPPEWFTKHFSPLVDRKGQLDRLVDKPLQSILDAIDEYAPTHKTILIDEMFEY